MLARTRSCFNLKHIRLQWGALGYKKYSDYNKIYCLDSQNGLLAFRALGNDKIRITTRLMPHYKAKLLLIISVILVSLLSNKSSTPFFEFEGKGIVNHDKALALQAHDPSPIYKTNSSSSDASVLVNKGELSRLRARAPR